MVGFKAAEDIGTTCEGVAVRNPMVIIAGYKESALGHFATFPINFKQT